MDGLAPKNSAGYRCGILFCFNNNVVVWYGSEGGTIPYQ